MAFYFASWWTELYACILAGILLLYAHFKLVTAKYWKNRNVAHLEPVFLLGNLWRASIMENINISLTEMHRKFKKDKLVGLWGFSKPTLLVTDIDIIKRILVKDFGHFRDHGLEVDAEREPLTGHLFNLKGAKWRNLRVKLTPTFTSGKMKMMFPTMMSCGRGLVEAVEREAKGGRELEVKELMSRFTTDVISSCAFGIEANSLKNPNSEFRKYGKKLFEPSFETVFNGLIFNISPALFNLLRLRFIPKDVAEFFSSAVEDTMSYRETNKVKRKDFLELLIQLKNKGWVADADEPAPLANGAPDEEESLAPENKFTVNDAAAQAFVFFFAGFETSSASLTFALYELALNTDVQETLQQEIDGTLAKSDGEVTYEGLMEMEYLDWVVQETLRKHPPAGALFRECNKEYEIPELKLKIEKNCPVLISTMAIHWDPEIYPNPDRFEPRRFSPPEKAKRDHYTHMPFGEGPRICIGNRFALLQIKTGLVAILSRYNVTVSSRTPSPLRYDPLNFLLSPKGGMFLKFVERS